ncbi:MAG: hypothetical protein HY834_17450 [Devosia nanyangense]|uniref:Uncharacterized protein n=1 Tax=Devosia nanyangense TaxID=1228055 RepID=A0A933P090_9HYPH|nr:hypothetical protein [Devosia nanyangense]
MQRRGGGWVGRMLLLMVAGLAGLPGTAAAQNSTVEPDFAIWDVQLGQPVTAIPDSVAAIIACGTNGGPMSIEIKSFGDWAQCTPEASGLREIAFTYDDENDYIARALELEYRALAGGTSVYAHPVIVSILVDDKGVSQGIRIVTDDRASDRERRVAVVLSKNFQARFGPWNLDCQDIPMREGEQKVGSEFIHQRCAGTNPDGSGQTVVIEGSYLRKKGQEGLSRETQQVNKGYYQSETRLELVNPPYLPSEGP